MGRPRIIRFGSADEYDRVKALAKRTLGIVMNDKHLRPRTLFAEFQGV
jgi:hypothetical protein